MEEGVLDVKLMDRLVPGEGEGENNTNGGELDDGAKGLVIVHSGTLGEASKDPAGLVAVEWGPGPSQKNQRGQTQWNKNCRW
jgi:hypothetical protein